MKKAIYLLAATALMASCNQEVLVDTPEPQPEAPRLIGFDTFVDKATRAEDLNLYNSTALNDFYPTFNVNGWKTVGGVTTPVFKNVTVEYFTADAKGSVVYKEDDQKPSDEWAVADPFVAGWYYENIRYWDKMASKYQYSAYAPSTASADVDCTSDGVIKIGKATAPVTVDPKNLKATPATTLSFTGFDKDYMTAQADAQPSADAADMSSPVSLIFKHLQAKLNIRIKLDASVKTAQDVSIQKIQVHNLGDKGYYTNDASATGTVSGWTLGAATATADEAGNTDDSGSADNNSGSTDDTAGDNSGATDNENATTSEYIPGIATPYSLNNATKNYNNHYVLEQLIIPQTINKYTEPTPTAAEGDEGSTGGDSSDEGTGDASDEGDGQGSEGATPAVVTLPVSLTEYAVACVYVEYTIGEETFKSYTPLANIFTTDDTYNFEGGNQYTLNITVGPKPIKFTAVVTEWAEATNGDLPMD